MRAALASAAILALASTTDAAPHTDAGWQAFVALASVLQSPRCLSCHVTGDAPLQGDDGHRHAMNVKRGVDGRGTPALRCTTCHQDANADALHGPPGRPDWRLPPPDMRMAWQGLSVEQLCDSLSDPARNGGRGLAELDDHLRHDAIVAWGFDPGPGRTRPPLSHAQLLAQFTAWRAAGAPCRPQGARDAR